MGQGEKGLRCFAMHAHQFNANMESEGGSCGLLLYIYIYGDQSTVKLAQTLVQTMK